MNLETKKRYQMLKEKNAVKIKEYNWKNNILFSECIEVLNNYNIISLDKTDTLFEILQKKFSMSSNGCINWNDVKVYLKINTVTDIKNNLNLNDSYYILWDQRDMPGISCKLSTILENIDDVLAVSFDTWLLSENTNEVIEFCHNGKITYGRTLD